MKNLFLCLMVLPFFGCASMFSGTDQRISVNSMDDKAVIYVDGVARGQGSVSVELRRKEDHTFMAKKDGCQSVMLNSGSSFNAVTLLGIFIDFGIVSIPIDFISGAAWNITPRSYTVTPICQEASSTVQ